MDLNCQRDKTCSLHVASCVKLPPLQRPKATLYDAAGIKGAPSIINARNLVPFLLKVVLKQLSYC